MIRRQITVTHCTGLHARPASIIVRTLEKFNADIRIHKDGQVISGKSIIGVLTLAAERGTKLTIVFDGPDEEAAAHAFKTMFIRDFGEVK